MLTEENELYKTWRRAKIKKRNNKKMSYGQFLTRELWLITFTVQHLYTNLLKTIVKLTKGYINAILSHIMQFRAMCVYGITLQNIFICTIQYEVSVTFLGIFPSALKTRAGFQFAMFREGILFIHSQYYTCWCIDECYWKKNNNVAK